MIKEAWVIKRDDGKFYCRDINLFNEYIGFAEMFENENVCNNMINNYHYVDRIPVNKNNCKAVKIEIRELKNETN